MLRYSVFCEINMKYESIETVFRIKLFREITKCFGAVINMFHQMPSEQNIMF